MSYHRPHITEGLRDMARVMDVPCHGHALMLMADAGLTIREIADKFDLPFGTIRWQAKKFGVDFPRKGRVIKRGLADKVVEVCRSSESACR